MRKIAVYAIIFLASVIFFSYRIKKVPPGLTIDEAAFGYNAVLLSNTLRDENNRLLPVFVLSIEGKDWRQPITQYFMTLYFKIFGPSVFNLRVTSVIIAGISSVLIFIFGEKLLGIFGGLFSLFFFVTTPILMIHSHLGLDNIMPIPFVIFWLLSVFLFEKKGSRKYLALSALSLGIGFYSYKGMRSFVPVWSLGTLVYLIFSALERKTENTLKEMVKSLAVFVTSIAPFYLITPVLEYKYAGAIFGQVNVKIDSIYKFLLSYFSSFDPSFLFITGDELPHHSTGVHGMLLLASLPFFLVGLYQAFKKEKFWIFLVMSFFSGPLLFGFPGSYHRASRLMAFIPIYAVISALGSVVLLKKKRLKFVLVGLVFLVVINYFDFVKYYWFGYPKDNYHVFYRTEIEKIYKSLKTESERRNLFPYTYSSFTGEEKVVDNFLRSIHFLNPLPVWIKEINEFPEDGILLSNNPNISGLEKIEINQENYFLYVKRK